MPLPIKTNATLDNREVVCASHVTYVRRPWSERTWSIWRAAILVQDSYIVRAASHVAVGAMSDGPDSDDDVANGHTFTFKPGAVELRFRDPQRGGKCKNLGFIPSSLLTIVDGNTFVELRTRKAIIRHILCAACNPQNYSAYIDIVMRTDVVYQLYSALRLESRRVIVGDQPLSEKTRVGDAMRQKRFRTSRLSLPAIISVESPQICDVPRVSFNVLSKKSRWPWVELSDASVKWLAAATKAQLLSGGVVKRTSRHKKTDMASPTNCATDASEHDDESPDDEPMTLHPVSPSTTGLDQHETRMRETLPSPAASSAAFGTPPRVATSGTTTSVRKLTPQPSKQLQLSSFFGKA